MSFKLIASTLVLLVVLMSTPPASAQGTVTDDDIRKQLIEVLLIVIERLQQQLPVVVEENSAVSTSSAVLSLRPSKALTIVPRNDQPTGEFEVLAFDLETNTSDAQLVTLTLENNQEAKKPLTDIITRAYLVRGDERQELKVQSSQLVYTKLLEEVPFQGVTGEYSVRVVFSPRSSGETELLRFKVSAEDVEITSSENKALQVEGTVSGVTHAIEVREGASAISLGGTESFSSTFTLRTNASNDTSDDEGEFTFTFSFASFGNDLYVNDLAILGNTLAEAQAAGAGFLVSVLDTDGRLLGDDEVVSVSVVDSNATQVTSGRYLVPDGQAESFTINVVLDPKAAGFYQVRLHGLAFNEFDADPASLQILRPVFDFETRRAFITN